MKKVCLFLGVIMVVLAFVAGCSAGQTVETASPSAESEAVVVATPQPTATIVPTPTPSPTPEPTPEPVRSYTSGKMAEDQSQPAKYQPIIVSIENSVGARPQVGLNAADIIYEFGVETAITRFQVLFNDNPPLFAGPVRSSRIYFMRLQQEWQAIYTHEGYGGPKYSEDWIALHATRSVKSVKKSFWRTKEAGKRTEHTMMANVQDIIATMYEDSGYVPAPYADRFHWMEGISYSDGMDFDRVTLNFFYRNAAEGEKITFIYDPETNTLSRKQDGYTFQTRMPSTASGKSPKTMNFIKENLVVQNLIVQYAEYSMIENDPKDRRNVELTGTGACEYFINGQHLRGTWSRPSFEEPTTYRLENGEVVVLEPGLTWIAVHPANAEESPVNVTYR